MPKAFEEEEHCWKPVREGGGSGRGGQSGIEFADHDRFFWPR